MAACSHLPEGWAGAGEEQVPARSGFSQSKGGEWEIICHVPQTQSAEGQMRECLGVPEAKGRDFLGWTRTRQCPILHQSAHMPAITGPSFSLNLSHPVCTLAL